MSKPEVKAALQAAQAEVTTKVAITKEYLVTHANDIMLKAKANGAWQRQEVQPSCWRS